MSAQSFAIIGASMAGARAAGALRRLGFDGEVHLVGAEERAPYDRPPLSKAVLLGTSEVADTQLEADGYWAQERIDLHLGQPVVALHASQRQIELADGSQLRADKVLLCTGGRPRQLSVPGSDLPGVFYLRTAEDAEGIRARLAGLVGGGRVVVVGAGFIGAEVAASARTLGCDVTLVEVAQVPLWRVLGEEMGRYYAQVHRDHGVSVLTGVGVVEVRGEGQVRGVVLSDGSTLEADLVVIGVGIEPATELAATVGAQIGNGILVDEYCQTTVPDVYAAGDVANHPDAIFGGRVRLEHWRNAQNQGAAAAASMLGQGKPFSEVPWFWSDQYDLTLQVAGHPHPQDDIVRRGDAEAGAFSVFYLRGGAVRAVLGVNRPGDVRAGMDLIAHASPVGAEVLADLSTDLRALARAARTGGGSAGRPARADDRALSATPT